MARSAAVPALAVVAVAAPALAFQALAPTAPSLRSTAASEAVMAGAAGPSPRPFSSTGAAAAVAVGLAALGASKAAQGTRQRRTLTAVRATEESFAGGLVGGESAFGAPFNFDPLGLSSRTPKFLPWWRESELKHGRIAMLAWLGLVVPEVIRLPGVDICYKASIIDAHKYCVGPDQEHYPVGPMLQGLMFTGFIEFMTTFPKGVQGLTLVNAGDYKLGTSFLPSEPAKVREMKLKELKNGRLAMLAFGGAITQAVLTNHGFPWLYAARTQRSSAGLAGSVPVAKGRGAHGASRTTMHAEGGGYKMSKAVPFLPVSPALEGFAGEEDGFDPIGMSLAIDIRWLRESELKHGRVAMLATVGWIATDLGVRVPGEPFANVTTIQAHDAMVKFGSMPQMLLWLGFLEIFSFLAMNSMYEGRTERQAGDYGLRFLYPSDPKGQEQMQLKELRNGRLAMLAYGGIATIAVLTNGKTWPFLAVGNGRRTVCSGSALCGAAHTTRATRAGVAARALETSASLPFLPKPQNLGDLAGAEIEFDPLGFSDTFDVKWLRESELKHGRICMLAVVGFAATQFISLPGAAPQEDALKAFWTAPPEYWGVLLLVVGFVESAAYNGKITMLDMFEDKDREAGNLGFGSSQLKGKSAKETSDIRLKELSNGRLAMFAIGGMVHHNLVVSGPLLPLFPEGWAGPQGTWQVDSYMTYIYDSSSFPN